MRIVFIGTGDIGVPALEWLLANSGHTVSAVVTQPDKPAGRRLELTPSPIKVLAQSHRIPVLQPRRIRDRSVTEQASLTSSAAWLASSPSTETTPWRCASPPYLSRARRVSPCTARELRGASPTRAQVVASDLDEDAAAYLRRG